MKISNIANGPRGFFRNGELITLAPGQSVEAEIDKVTLAGLKGNKECFSISTGSAKAAADKERYEKEKEAWIAAGGGGKKDKPREGPKRPMNASFLYVNAKREEYRKANPEAKLGEVTKALSDQFKALSDEARKEWDDKAAADKARYERELAEAKK